MKFYEYDTEGFLIGWHEDEARPRSTSVDFRPIPGNHARWNGSAWIADTSRAVARDADATAERTRKQQAIAALRAFNPATATNNDIKQAVGHIVLVIKHLVQEAT